MEIQVSGVVKEFGDKRVLKDLTFHVHDKQFVALLGPSGCGKTTLLNILAGFIEIEGGSVKVGDTVWSRPGYTMPPERRNVGMVFQDFALWPHMTVFDNIAFGLKLRKTSSIQIRQRVHEVLDIVRMSGYAESYPHELSGGQKQRIAIARALAPEPSVLLMDEPLSSLDAKLREQMRWDLLDIIRRAGITTIYVTHDQSEALSMADHIVLLNEGRLEQEGTGVQLYKTPRTPFAATFLGASNLLEGKIETAADGMLRVDCHGHILRAHEPIDRQNDGGHDDENSLHSDLKSYEGMQCVVSVRPNEIRLLSSGQDHSGNGSLLVGHIAQRAFHGAHWRYRIQLEGSPVIGLEVWDSQEWQVSDKVLASIPVSSCRVLDGKARLVTVG